MVFTSHSKTWTMNALTSWLKDTLLSRSILLASLHQHSRKGIKSQDTFFEQKGTLMFCLDPAKPSSRALLAMIKDKFFPFVAEGAQSDIQKCRLFTKSFTNLIERFTWKKQKVSSLRVFPLMNIRENCVSQPFFWWRKGSAPKSK